MWFNFQHDFPVPCDITEKNQIVRVVLKDVSNSIDNGRQTIKTACNQHVRL